MPGSMADIYTAAKRVRNSDDALYCAQNLNKTISDASSDLASIDADEVLNKFPELITVIRSFCQEASESYIEGPCPCGDESLEHHLECFGNFYGLAMYLAGRASRNIPLSHFSDIDIQPTSPRTHEEWEQIKAQYDDEKEVHEEKVAAIRARVQELMPSIAAELGIDIEDISIMSGSDLTRLVAKKAAPSSTEPSDSPAGFGMYL